MRILSKKLPRAEFITEQSGRRRRLTRPTLKELFLVFEENLSIPYDKDLDHAYWLFTKGIKHPEKMTEVEYWEELRWAEEITSSGRLNKLCVDYLDNVRSTVKRLPPEE